MIYIVRFSFSVRTFGFAPPVQPPRDTFTSTVQSYFTYLQQKGIVNVYVKGGEMHKLANAVKELHHMAIKVFDIDNHPEVSRTGTRYFLLIEYI